MLQELNPKILKQLYIPFWLYSNLTLIITIRQGILLYIPFWLYSNNTDIDNKTNVTAFTFHSGYILM